LASAAAFVGFAFSTQVWHLYLLAIVLGVGFANITTMPISIVLNNWFGGKIRGTAMGFTFIGSGIGGLIMIPVLSSIITTFSWRAGYLTIAGIFLIILLPCILFLVVKTPEEKGFTRMGQKAEETSLAEAEGLIMKEAVKTPMLWLTSLSCILFVFASSAILFNSAPYYIECGFSTGQAAMFASLNLGMLAIGKPVTGWVCDKLGTKFGSICSPLLFFLMCVFLFLLPQSPHVLIYFVIFCYGIGGGGITVCPPLLVNSLFGEKDYGNIIAVMTMATNLGGAFGGTIAAMIFDVTGSYTTFWAIAAGGMIVSALCRVISFQLRKKYSFTSVA
jgi:MFS family permease